MTKLLFSFFIVFTSLASANCKLQKPTLLKAGEILEQNFEVFHDSLHDYKAEEGVIKSAHHLEDGLTVLLEDLKSGVTCGDLYSQFQEFHKNVQDLYKELSKNEAVFYLPPVLNSWNRLLPSFVRFQNILY